MWKYYIQETELGRIIKKFFEEQGVKIATFYRDGKERETNKESAKTYFFKNDALSMLMIAKRC